MMPALAAAAPQRASSFDYTKVRGLSQPVSDFETEVVRLPAFDGKRLYLEVTRPLTTARVPVIMVASPYHGTIAEDRSGSDLLPEPHEDGKQLGLTGFFAPRGFAVVMMDLRGTGLSEGCLDHLGPNDAKDLEQVIEWAAAQPWSNGRVGMIGHSYVGSSPIAAAAQNPRGLATIVPSAGLPSMYEHQFQGGVPYFLQYIGPQVGYASLAVMRDLPVKARQSWIGTGANFGNDPTATGCGMASSALLAGSGQVTGQYEAWHAARDWSKAATASRIPMFLVHGVNDGQVRSASIAWFADRGGRPGDKAWIGQWGHGHGALGSPTHRGKHWPFALLAWFDKHLKGKRVQTGPPAEVFLNDAPTLEGAVADEGRREVLVAGGYPAGTSSLRLFPAADGALGRAPGAAGTQSFTGDPRGFLGQATGSVVWTSAPFNRDVVVAGMPELTLVASVSTPQVHLLANVLDRSPDGSTRRIGHFALNPLLRNGLGTVTPVVPGEVMTLPPPAFAMAHRIAKGHSLVLEVKTSDPDKAPMSTADARVTVLTGARTTELRLPVVAAPRLLPAR